MAIELDDDDLEQGKQPQQDPEVKKAVEAVATHIAMNYRPAQSFRTAKMRITTSELMQRLNDHFPGMISSTQLHVLMNKLGFKQDSVEFNFYWLIDPK